MAPQAVKFRNRKSMEKVEHHLSVYKMPSREETGLPEYIPEYIVYAEAFINLNEALLEGLTTDEVKEVVDFSYDIEVQRIILKKRTLVASGHSERGLADKIELEGEEQSQHQEVLKVCCGAIAEEFWSGIKQEATASGVTDRNDVDAAMAFEVEEESENEMFTNHYGGGSSIPRTARTLPVFPPKKFYLFLGFEPKAGFKMINGAALQYAFQVPSSIKLESGAIKILNMKLEREKMIMSVKIADTVPQSQSSSAPFPIKTENIHIIKGLIDAFCIRSTVFQDLTSSLTGAIAKDIDVVESIMLAILAEGEKSPPSKESLIAMTDLVYGLRNFVTFTTVGPCEMVDFVEKKMLQIDPEFAIACKAKNHRDLGEVYEADNKKIKLESRDLWQQLYLLYRLQPATKDESGKISAVDLFKRDNVRRFLLSELDRKGDSIEIKVLIAALVAQRDLLLAPGLNGKEPDDKPSDDKKTGTFEFVCSLFVQKEANANESENKSAAEAPIGHLVDNFRSSLNLQESSGQTSSSPSTSLSPEQALEIGKIFAPFMAWARFSIPSPEKPGFIVEFYSRARQVRKDTLATNFLVAEAANKLVDNLVQECLADGKDGNEIRHLREKLEAEKAEREASTATAANASGTSAANAPTGTTTPNTATGTDLGRQLLEKGAKKAAKKAEKKAAKKAGKK